MVNGLYSLHPTISVRHWFFWVSYIGMSPLTTQYHLFTAAVCVGTLILRNPQSVLAQFALSQIDQAINLFSAVLKHNPSPSMVQNHEWLVRLRQRAVVKISNEGQRPNQGDGQSLEGEEDVELLGWRTRLIEQAGAGHRATNILPKTRPDMTLSNTAPIPPVATGTLGQVAPAPSPLLPPAVAEVLGQHLDFSLDPSMVSDASAGSAPATGGDSSTDLLVSCQI